MNNQESNNIDFSREFKFSASRSSGPGGQNVNKVNSKVELRFQIDNSQLLSEGQKALLKNRLSNYINSKGELLIVSQTERTQLKNKEKCISKFYFLLRKGIVQKKVRKPTQPSKSSNIKRLNKKRLHSMKKLMRSINIKNE